MFWGCSYLIKIILFIFIFELYIIDKLLILFLGDILVYLSYLILEWCCYVISDVYNLVFSVDGCGFDYIINGVECIIDGDYYGKDVIYWISIVFWNV